ncbi:MAG TPA: Dickkopf N-terminal cysteine-rich domain-containing protein [Kofleriaceae bacterium]|jgi:hypothetical protein
MGHARYAVIAVLFAACGGDDGGGIPVEDYQAQRLTAECERLVRCGLFTTQEACEGYVIDTFDIDVKGGIDAKRVKYDGGKAKDCIAAIAAQSCDQTSASVRDLPPACKAVTEGTVADGEACNIEAECISGTCDQPACSRQTCCAGTCAATIKDAPDGASCVTDDNCVDGAFCGDDDHTCHSLLAASADCQHDNECNYGLTCIGETDLQKGKCRALPAIGDACPYMLCADVGAVCTNGTCVAVGLAPAPCTDGTQCSPFGRCAPDGHCAEMPVLGEPCVDKCRLGSWCDSGTCAALRANADACNNDDECPDHFCGEGPIFDACGKPPICD